MEPCINPFETELSHSKKMKKGLVEPAFVFEDETLLTVSKTSLFFSGDGFSVYDCNAQLVFRVDTYGPDAQDQTELVLMDATGRCLLTVRRKKRSLHHRWEGYVGERMEGHKPIFSVRRSSMMGRSSVTVEIFQEPQEEFQIEGSFAQRCCTIYNPNKEPVAEIRRKVDVSTNVVLGKDVFYLILKPGFDGAFAMGLVLVLDQINGDGFVEVEVEEEEEEEDMDMDMDMDKTMTMTAEE